MGTIASLGGATIITLHKGLPLLNQTEPIQGRTPLTEEMSSSTDMQNWKWGCIYLLGHCVAWASWMVFQPLQTTLVAVMATLVLGDQLYSGGIIGALLIMLGLYSV
ncbi:PREDICTED: WALLS ARE THIN [Prunus dulcis]|uniref:PREDICTED: WALLS ARE THIN n=1 Tax=Prunus dulcis TaxID=3755 RepID=A0A5E4FZS4_PRUDU|nr:PREDICTED: WALLS ARE THIN [Prunus dulcis]